MRHYISLIMLALCLSVSAQSSKKIAVIDFLAGVGINQNEVEGISAIFITSFNPQGYTLVERTQIENVIKEQNFQSTSLTQAQMVKVGEILNLKYIVVGDVNVVNNQYNLDVRAIDVESGGVIAKEGKTWDKQASYRTQMSELATSLSKKLNEITTVPRKIQNTNTKVYDSPIILYDYLVVYPKPLGFYNNTPTSLIKQLNDQKSYKYNTWRLPNAEELEIIKNNISEIEFLKANTKLLSVSNPQEGQLLLVTTKQEQNEHNERAELLKDYNGHDFVDLGLSVKWATCNLGATNDFEIGKFYTWGASVTDNDSSSPLEKTREELFNAGIIDKNGNLTPEYDVATQLWGGPWRMPTKEELEELVNNCYICGVINKDDFYYYQFTSRKNGNHIIFPRGTIESPNGWDTYNWSSTVYESEGNNNAYSLYFVFEGWNVKPKLIRKTRSEGLTVRAVAK